MFSSFFIRRPIFASVLSIVIVLAGIFGMRALPIEQYPQIVPPSVAVTTAYPGASAEVIADTVASPLEQAINGVDDMLYMQSSSASNGRLTINVTFKIGTNPDQASINVNNRVQSVLSSLPGIGRLLQHKNRNKNQNTTNEANKNNNLTTIPLYNAHTPTTHK